MENRIGIPLLEEIDVTGLVSAFYYSFPENFDYEGEEHAGWEFVYVEKGKVSVRADNETYIIKGGEMVCHKPHEFHMVKPYQGRASVIIICFDCKGARMKYFNNKILTINQRQKQYLNDIAENAEQLFIPKDPLNIAKDGKMDRSAYASISNEQYIKNTLELLILSLMKSESTEKSKRAEFYEHAQHRRTLTSDISEYLLENIDKKVSLSDISKKFSYSLSSIKRIFKAETGCSISAHHAKLKIEKAKELLLDEELSIEDISRLLGYKNIYYFSNTFKEKTGKSPSRYRNEHLS